MTASAAWIEQADDLVDWVRERIVNRTDARGVYDRGARTAKTELTDDHIRQHFAGVRLVGFHSTSKSGTCKWLGLDVDCHEDNSDKEKKNEHEVKSLFVTMQDLFDFHPLIFDSDGSGSYHVLILFEHAIPVKDAHRFGKYIRKEFGLDCELFPKQEKLPPRGFGNWLRLFGRHHTKESHWSRVWNGVAWLESGAAIDYILKHDGDAGEVACDTKLQIVGSASETNVVSRETSGVLELSAYTLKYRLEGAKKGERNNSLFRAACDYRGSGRPIDECIRDLSTRALDDGISPQEASTAIDSAYSQPRDPIGRGVSAIDRYNDNAAPGRTAAPCGDLPDSPTDVISELSADQDRPLVANFVQARNNEGGRINVVRPVESISREVSQISSGWPRRVGGQLFTLSNYDRSTIPGQNAVRYLKSTDDLFAWVHSQSDLLWVASGTKSRRGETRTPVSKSEFAAHLRDTVSPSYESIEFLPHYPLVPGVYYVPIDLPTPTGDCLQEFIDRTNPETPEDKALLTAALVTPGYGGAPGTRPAFVLSSAHGRGVGKTATVTAFTEMWGGAISICGGGKQDWAVATSRLLDDAALSMRCVMMDNVKGKFSATELESMLTAPRIDGKRMYVGQFSRPNLLTYFITANVPRMSSDLSERSVIIQIGQPQWGFNFVEWSQRFVADNRPQLISDSIHWLQQDDKCDIASARLTRWSGWSGGVMSKMPNGPALLDLIAQRRAPVDSDQDEAVELAILLRNELSERSHSPDSQRVLITRVEMIDILERGRVLEGKLSKRRVYGYLMSLIGSGMIPVLSDYNTGRSRCWLWSGSDSTHETRAISLSPRNIIGEMRYDPFA